MVARSRRTFVFSDIDNSTKLWDAHPASMSEALERHDRIVDRIVRLHDGFIFKHTGDGFAGVFADGPSAVAAALEVRAALAAEEWGKTPIEVRLGIHTGDAEERGDDYFGVTVSRCARIAAAANPGQIVASGATVDGCGALGATVAFHSVGPHYLRGLADPLDLHIVDGVDASADLRPLRSVNSVPTNLPSTPPVLVGRSRQLEAVRDALHRERIVTLTGVGGVGKTSLALVAASASRGDHPDGVWFVDLTAISDPELVLYQIAHVLDLEPPALRSLSEALADAIGTSHTLLVLDNCEHVVDEAARAARTLIAACPGLAVLATSREPLEVREELAFGVEPLSVPLDEKADLMASSAARLLIDRARGFGLRIALDPATSAAIASICRRVDGVPLALELASSRLRVLTPTQLDRELSSAFEVLSSRDRSAPARHRTLDATIRWSYDLATTTEQRLLERLAAFRGGFTLESATAVSELAAASVRDALEGLVVKSLVVASAGVGRFRLLEAVRGFARDRCLEHDDFDAAQHEHLRWVVSLCAAETPKLLTAEQLSSLEQLTTELPNIRAALRFAVDTTQSETGLEIAAGLARFWYLAALHTEGASWIDELMATGSTLKPVTEARALTTAAMTLVRIGHVEEARASATKAVRLLEGTDERQALGWAYYYLAVSTVEPYYTNAEEVLAYWRLALESFRAAEFRPGEALSQFFLAGIAGFADAEVGVEEITPVLATMRKAGNPNGIAHAAEFLALFKATLGDHGGAVAPMIEALQQHHVSGNWTCLGHALEGVAHQHVLVGRFEEAVEIFGGVDTLRLSLSTVRAPYEMFYQEPVEPLQEALGTRYSSVRERGAAWSREELLDNAIEAMRALAAST